MPISIHPDKRLYILLHALGWGIILIIPSYLIATYGGEHGGHFLYQFYLNYLWLVPRYFLKEGKVAYFLFAAVLIVVLYFISYFVSEYIFHDSEHEKEIAKIFSQISRARGEEIHPPIRQFKVYNFFSTAALVTGFSLGLGVLQQLSKNEKKRKELEKEKLNSELAFLKSQVSPHFFFNTLNNIYTLIGIDTEEAQDAVLKLSKLMRYLLYDSEGSNSRLSDEINFMNHYIDLMKLRINRKVDLTVDLPGNVPELSIPPLLFIAFIENAFKHGVSYREQSFIRIRMDVDEAQIRFEARNSIGRSGTEGENKHSGIGLENVKKRLDLLYPGLHELKITESPEEFAVCLTINLKK
jgi:sensor histidine kinase YesM